MFLEKMQRHNTRFHAMESNIRYVIVCITIFNTTIFSKICQLYEHHLTMSISSLIFSPDLFVMLQLGIIEKYSRIIVNQKTDLRTRVSVPAKNYPNNHTLYRYNNIVSLSNTKIATVICNIVVLWSFTHCTTNASFHVYPIYNVYTILAIIGLSSPQL